MELKDYFQRKFGDRYDGWRVRELDGVMALTPFLQRTRIDSMCYFEENVELEPLEAFVKAHKEDLPGLSIMHIVIAAMVRAFSQRPYCNRFIVYNKLFAHNDIRISLMIKRAMTDKGEETAIMPRFNPYDTLREVVAKINAEVEANRAEAMQNETDKLVALVGKMPTWLLRIFVGVVRRMDYVGILPKAFHDVSPYHCSAFITNVGSLGINPIYHHLYEFGTCSFFAAMGKKNSTVGFDPEGRPIQVKTMGFRYVVDERVCDGHYNAVTIRYMRKLLNKPEALLAPPAKIVLDDGLGRPPLFDPEAGFNDAP